MVKEGKSQSVVISGESGAGKTESAKVFLEFMAHVGKGAGSLHEKVLRTNPVMEAFGNARTVLNDNSSRFGKFLRLEFTASGKMCGASLKTYLLEKTRIVAQAASEQNYHVFYHLAHGAPATLLAALQLDAGAEWRCLGNNAAEARRAPHHAARFSEICAALATLGLSSQHADKLWAVVAAVLRCANLTFVGAGEGCTLADSSPLALACAQLGLDPSQAAEALLSRKIKVGAEVIPKPNTPAEAAQVRERASERASERARAGPALQ
jgi:myosin heavy subunit